MSSFALDDGDEADSDGDAPSSSSSPPSAGATNRAGGGGQPETSTTSKSTTPSSRRSVVVVAAFRRCDESGRWRRPTGDVDDVKERDTVVAKAVTSGPPTRTR